MLSASVALAGCNTDGKEATLKFESVSDSLYQPGGDYLETSLLWKKYYEDCMFQQIMPDAFYLQLQSEIYISSINNQNEVVVNKGIHLIDTSNNKEISSLLVVLGSGNCRESQLPLNKALKQRFFMEVQRVLNKSPEYKNIAVALDSGAIKIQTGSLYHNALRLDSLVRLFKTTKDSSLLRYRDLLLEPENVLLGQAVELFGFTAEIPLKQKPDAVLAAKLSTEQLFEPDNPNEHVSIRLLPENILQVQLNKRYTVLGRFFKLTSK